MVYINTHLFYSNNLFSESAGLGRLGIVGEEVNEEELSLKELLLLTKPEDGALDVGEDVFLPPINLSDIFGGVEVGISHVYDSRFGDKLLLHLHPVAVHL